MSKFVWGIDVGRSSLKAVKVEKMKGRLEICDIELVEFEQHDSEEVDREEQVREALARLKSRKKFKGEPVFISIPGHGTFNRTVSLPPVDAKQIPEMVRWEAQQQIPFPIDEVIWDYQKIDSGEDFGEVEINLFAVKKEIVNNFLSNLQATDIEISGIQIAPLALFNFIVYDQQPTSAMVVIDMGAEYSDLVVINGDRIWIRNLQIAGNDITRAVQSKFQIPFGEAEKLKLKAAKSKHAQKIFAVMRPILKDLVGEIHRSIGYYKSQNSDIRFEKVLLMGNGTKLVGFKRFFRDNLADYSIELIKGLNRISVSNRVNVNLLSQNIASFGIAIGLAIQAAGEAVNKVVLLPESIRHEKELAKKKPIYVLALLIIAAVLGFKWWSSDKLLSDLKEQKTQAQEHDKNVKDVEQRWEQAKKWGDLQLELSRVKQIEPYREEWVKIVKAILDTIPDTNNRKRGDSIQKDKDMVWLFDVAFKRTLERVAVKGSPRGKKVPDKIRHWIEGKVAVCIVSSGEGQDVQNANRVTVAVVDKLKASLKEVSPDAALIEIVGEPDYEWIPVRTKDDLQRRRFRPQSQPHQGHGAFFLQWVKVRVPLNKIETEEEK